MSNLNQIPAEFSRDLVAGNVKNAMKSVDAKSRDLWMVTPSSLKILSDFNVRPKNDEYFACVREIADSIKANGFYPHKPFAVIVIKENGEDVLAVYDGHTRYDGLQLAISEGFSVERVPAVSAPAGTSLEDITIGLHKNNSGSPLSPMGIAILCKRLVGYGMDVDEIATRMGFTAPYVTNLLSLMSAPKKIRDLVADGKVAATLAIATLREEGENAVSVLEAGLVSAVAAGKVKITAKVLKTSKPVPKSALEKGLDFIESNGKQETHFAMLAFITGKSIVQLKSLI